MIYLSNNELSKNNDCLEETKILFDEEFIAQVEPVLFHHC